MTFFYYYHYLLLFNMSDKKPLYPPSIQKFHLKKPLFIDINAVERDNLNIKFTQQLQQPKNNASYNIY